MLSQLEIIVLVVRRKLVTCHKNEGGNEAKRRYKTGTGDMYSLKTGMK